MPSVQGESTGRIATERTTGVDPSCFQQVVRGGQKPIGEKLFFQLRTTQNNSR